MVKGRKREREVGDREPKKERERETGVGER